MNKLDVITKINLEMFAYPDLEPEEDDGPPIDFKNGYNAASKANIKIINQLNESRGASWQDAIEILEEHFGCEIPRNLDNVVKGYREMSGILNTVEFELSKMNSDLTAKEFIFEALESKKQKVKVPAFVNEWINQHCYLGKYVCLERFMCQYNNVELPTELYNYYDRDKDGARDKVISAILDGYEVEEPLWVIEYQEKYLNDIQFKKRLHNLIVEADGVWGSKNRAMRFTSEEQAERILFLSGGTVEKV